MVLFLILIVFLFRPVSPIYNGLSVIQLQRYIAYSVKSLRNEGYFQIIPESIEKPFILRKKEFKRKGDQMLLTMSSGDHPYENIKKASETLSDHGIENKLLYTKGLQLPRQVGIIFQSNDVFLPSAVTNVLNIICSTLSSENSEIYTIHCGLPSSYKPGYFPEDGEVIKYKTSAKLGAITGTFLGALVRGFNLRKKP